MLQSIALETPLKVIGPDNTVLWQGSGFLGTVLLGVAKVAVTESNVVVVDPTTFIVQGSNLAATATPVANGITLRPSRVTGTSPTYETGILGCALNTAAIGSQVSIAGAGSIALVTVASATGTLGHHALLSSTAGTVTSSATAPTAASHSPGYVVKAAGTTGGATDTGSATRMGIYVSPHAA